MRAQGRSVDLARGAVKLSSHLAGALRSYKSKDLPDCASELYQADALLSKIIPRLEKEGAK